MTHKESPSTKNAFLQQLDSLDVSVTSEDLKASVV